MTHYEANKKWLLKNLNYKKNYYATHEKYRKKNQEYVKKYAKTKKGKRMRKEISLRYYYNHHKQRLKEHSDYMKTEKGKLANAKHYHKWRNNYKFNIKYDNILDEPFEYHHINNNNVVTIPTDLHKLYGGGNKIVHRFMVNQIIKQLYGV